MTTLLEKAKAIKEKRPKCTLSDEHIELALAWLKSEITYTQTAISLGKSASSSAVYIFLNRALRLAYETGKIEIKN